MVLRKLKRLLGLDSGEDDRAGRSERDVTVQDRDDAETETESAVKGVDESDGDEQSDDEESTDEDEELDEPVAADTDADASTEAMVDEELASEEPAGRAEPAEAAGPESEDESTDIEGAETEVADETETADSPSVDEIKGIGPAYSERLAEIGIETVDDLRDADAGEVAERTTAPEGTVQKWIDRANDYE